MGRQITIDGEPGEYEEDMPVHELKDEAGIPQEKVLTVDRGQKTHDLADTDKVEDIPEGSTVAPLPDSGAMYG